MFQVPSAFLLRWTWGPLEPLRLWLPFCEGCPVAAEVFGLQLYGELCKVLAVLKGRVGYSSTESCAVFGYSSESCAAAA